MLKVLFINSFAQPDYLSNMIYIGLAERDDIEIYTYAAPFFLMKDIGWDNKFVINSKWEGVKKVPGFTVYEKVTKGPIIEWSQEIKNKIQERFYDKIIFSNIWRDTTFYLEATSSYNKKDIIFIDGDDHYLTVSEAAEYGKYFKRELYSEQNNIYPISMAVPTELVQENNLNKIKLFGNIYPGVVETYNFKTEKSYFDDYKQSYYGVTCKKGGWDCLRHYEILANNCIPYFLDLENCPPLTLHNFPKSIILETNKYAAKNLIHPNYNEINQTLLQYTRQHLTTQALINYIL